MLTTVHEVHLPEQSHLHRLRCRAGTAQRVISPSLSHFVSVVFQGHLQFFMKEHEEAMKTYELGLSYDKDNQELKEGLMRCQQAINKVRCWSLCVQLLLLSHWSFCYHCRIFLSLSNIEHIILFLAVSVHAKMYLPVGYSQQHAAVLAHLVCNAVMPVNLLVSSVTYADL